MRASGILLHPTSLPGRFGIGELGREARRFIDFLVGAGQRLWQVLPLGETGFGNSPYQCFSAFAGHPLLIDLETLAGLGYLPGSALENLPEFPENEVDYEAVWNFKLPLLRSAARNFQTGASAAERQGWQAFCSKHAAWLEDYAVFMALKEAHGGRAWMEWEPPLARREPAALEHWRRQLPEAIFARKYWQFEFFRQWKALKDYCHDSGIQIIGDIPIYVAHDSADVWAHRELFQLDRNGRPKVVAGVPPDYFSATGQLWGNPLYRWRTMARDGYRWWIERFRANRALVDAIRLDHFRGFEAYWEVNGNATTAALGRWVRGPGAALFKAVRKELGDLPIIAENLGLITPEVEALRHRLGFPGMAVLQFAFGSDPECRKYQPHNFIPELVAYTGTHDNDTTVGWWNSFEAQKNARSYFGTDGAEIHWVLIRALLASVAQWVVVPLQDVLGLGSEARMNMPGRPEKNWTWRFRSEMLTTDIRERLRGLTEAYERT